GIGLNNTLRMNNMAGGSIAIDSKEFNPSSCFSSCSFITITPGNIPKKIKANAMQENDRNCDKISALSSSLILFVKNSRGII
ncbi:hypothetical protein, partial [Escherichia coli]|uniref:hypothetical protein n=1 Tax=Escherichia coli TaxID=562 RepID=UPI003891F861